MLIVSMDEQCRKGCLWMVLSWLKIAMWCKDSDEVYFIEVDVQYSEKIHDLHNYLPFLPKRMKIKKVENLAAILHDKISGHTHKKF